LRLELLYEGLLRGKDSRDKDNLVFRVLEELKSQNTKRVFESFLAGMPGSKICAIFS